jgi:hypothetical protein
MTQLSKKENVWSAAIGVLIGSMAGLLISLSMVKEAKRCELLKKENQLLREMVMHYQQQEVCGE